MQVQAIQIPDQDFSVRATCSHAAVSRAERDRVYCFRVCAGQSTSFEILNPAGLNRRKGAQDNSTGFLAPSC